MWNLKAYNLGTHTFNEMEDSEKKKRRVLSDQ